MLETFGLLEARGAKGPASREVDALHTFIEALRLAYVDRARFIGDPAFVEVPVARLLGPAYLAELAAQHRSEEGDALDVADAQGAAPAVAGRGRAAEEEHHAHLGDRSRRQRGRPHHHHQLLLRQLRGGEGHRACCSTIEMDDFAGQPGVPNTFGLVMGEANGIAPGKIPVSSMTPTLVFMKGRDHDVLLAVGSPGGSTIPTTVMQVISNVVDLRPRRAAARWAAGASTTSGCPTRCGSIPMARRRAARLCRLLRDVRPTCHRESAA